MVVTKPFITTYHLDTRGLSNFMFLGKRKLLPGGLLVLQATLYKVQAETCIKLLNNREETRTLKRSPGRIWKWDSAHQDFVLVEALKSDNKLVCSVDFVKDLRGKSITVAADHMNPYIIINANQTGVTGFIGDVWTTLEETLKFTTIYRRATQSAGWTLMNGRAHALLEATVIYSYTSGYYTYSVPITSNYYALFVQSEGTRVSTWWYASIFSPGLWITAGLFIISIVFIIMGIYSLRKIVCTNYVECDDELSSLSFVLLFVLGGISGQGCQKIPFSWSLRLTILSFLIMGMLLSCGFSSTLTSYLTIGVTSVPITSLEDVAQKRTHSLCVRNDSSAYIHFTVNGLRGEELMPEWKGLVNEDCPDVRDLFTLSSKLCRPGFVYLEGPDIFLSIYHQVQDQCRYVKLPHAYWRLKLAFQHARASEYRKVIDVHLMRLRSVGILDYLEKKWFTKERNNGLGQPQWSDFRAVEYDHIHVATDMLSDNIVF
ncbi:hypothetical protein KPH14_001800 [Odynerus spinipes]|uniref:Ionotropic glutamate receptor C-terminal domain-containing protein n=1 Tax=Odynerus spinipes TaxID=1348599 RepID=A0AAD9RZS8_9HYME|nr:hypothetical protein KPH14_001800 [Odynerus spinipes]